MNYKSKIKIISWNVRGLNERHKRLEIRKTIITEKPGIVCLQETKMSQMDSHTIKETCGNNLKQARMLEANGTRGGILIAWNGKRFEELDYHIRQFTVTVLLKNKEDQQQFYMTGVYGPCTTMLRNEFLDELRDIKPGNNTPWLVCGDFNFTLQASDRNRA